MSPSSVCGILCGQKPALRLCALTQAKGGDFFLTELIRLTKENAVGLTEKTGGAEYGFRRFAERLEA